MLEALSSMELEMDRVWIRLVPRCARRRSRRPSSRERSAWEVIRCCRRVVMADSRVCREERRFWIEAKEEAVVIVAEEEEPSARGGRAGGGLEVPFGRGIGWVEAWVDFWEDKKV